MGWWWVRGGTFTVRVTLRVRARSSVARVQGAELCVRTMSTTSVLVQPFSGARGCVEVRPGVVVRARG